MAAMVVGAATMRLLPHPPNFTPIAAMALFGGACFDRKLWAFVVPLAGMLASDVALEILTGHGFHTLMPVVYLSFAAITGLGLLIRRRRQVWSIAAASLAASTLFFLTTNFAVWLFGSFYPKTAAGLFGCYVAALPFFGSTIAGDLFYTAVLFTGLTVAERRFRMFAPPQAA